MKLTLDSNAENVKGDVIKTFIQAAAKEKVFFDECSVEKILACLDLDKQSNWRLVIGWMYVYGCQLYKGNHVTQNTAKFVKIGIRRFMHNLAMFQFNQKLGVAYCSGDTYKAHIEVKTFRGLLATEDLNQSVKQFAFILNRLGVCFNGVGYTAYVETRGDGDDKIIWCPVSCIDTGTSSTTENPQ